MAVLLCSVSFMLSVSVIMLNILMLSVIMLSVIMLNVMAPTNTPFSRETLMKEKKGLCHWHLVGLA
jgi:hypothetical protein